MLRAWLWRVDLQIHADQRGNLPLMQGVYDGIGLFVITIDISYYDAEGLLMLFFRE